MVVDQPAHTPSYRDPAALIHSNLVYHSSPSTVNSDPQRAADAASVVSVTSPGAAPQTYSLEDIPGRCAYFMGPTSEQDGFLLDAFRYGILSEKYNLDANIAQVHSGSALPDDKPVHFLFLEVGHPDNVNRARQDASDSIEAKVWPYGDNLVRLYFRHVHPVFPIVSKVRFLRRYQTDKKNIPACLRGAMYALASVFWSYDVALRGTPVPFQQYELVDYAHQALRREVENPNLFVLQACLLLIHVTPPTIDSMEAPTTWTFAAQATACAQMIGLHLEPGQWNINATEKHLRRKLWWATFYSDCWSSICHGNPPHISNTSFNTAPLTMEDVRCDEEVPEDLQYLVEPPDASFEVSTGARFMQMIHIARSLRTVLDSSFQVNTSARTINDSLEAQNELVTVQAKLRDWTSLIPSCLVVQKDERTRSNVTSYNCPLHLSFYAAQVLLYRALMHPPTRQAKTTPGSNLRKWFPEALLAFEAFADFLSCVNKADLFGFWGRHARSQLILCGNFLVFLFMLASDRRDIERAYRLLESFHGTMHALYDVDHVQVNTLLRAAAIRIDSFFAQAAEIMRSGGDGNISAAHPSH
ncbi:Zn(II)2Cys6 transcription factor [Purpureocillium lavendulum]|uniref:Zn(II)2Cys6 transcription factor n=1 Tax=Purpureocillium lavendulum TaxID=1247861 RepID=A0AB34FN31_9HYPO|nr:Zn(II)2Cys6 transcription factor [Purpureocillium lavendulum]